MRELDDVLSAIFERGRSTARGVAVGDFADIRAAFSSLRKALDLPEAESRARPDHPAPGSTPAAPRIVSARHERPAAATDDLGDIRAAFAEVIQALELPARGKHARSPGSHPALPTDAVSDRLLDHAAEAQACAWSYRGTPEWQQITTVTRGTRPDHCYPTGIRKLVGGDPTGYPRPRVRPHCGRPGVPGCLESRARSRQWPRKGWAQGHQGLEGSVRASPGNRFVCRPGS
jgi:hypothetical protein